MTAHTPKAANHQTLAPLASRYVDVAAIPWEPTPYPGVEWKVLLKDEETGLLTALFKWAPGSDLPLHDLEIEMLPQLTESHLSVTRWITCGCRFNATVSHWLQGSGKPLGSTPLAQQVGCRLGLGRLFGCSPCGGCLLRRGSRLGLSLQVLAIKGDKTGNLIPLQQLVDSHLDAGQLGPFLW